MENEVRLCDTDSALFDVNSPQVGEQGMYCVLTSEDDWRLLEWRDGTHVDVATITPNVFRRPAKGNVYKYRNNVRAETHAFLCLWSLQGLIRFRGNEQCNEPA